MILKTTEAIAFGMEGAGVCDESNGALIIKGVCDYTDSLKCNVWQTFAAVTAALAVQSTVAELFTDIPLRTPMPGTCWPPKAHAHGHPDLIWCFRFSLRCWSCDKLTWVLPVGSSC